MVPKLSEILEDNILIKVKVGCYVLWII